MRARGSKESVAYDERLAERLRQLTRGKPGVTEKRMFGGVCFLMNGNMWVGIVEDDLMLRVGPEQYERSLQSPHARPMDFTGRPLRGMVYVSPSGFQRAAGLKKWVGLAESFVSTLPQRKPKAKKANKRSSSAKRSAGEAGVVKPRQQSARSRSAPASPSKSPKAPRIPAPNPPSGTTARSRKAPATARKPARAKDAGTRKPARAKPAGATRKPARAKDAGTRKPARAKPAGATARKPARAEDARAKDAGSTRKPARPKPAQAKPPRAKPAGATRKPLRARDATGSQASASARARAAATASKSTARAATPAASDTSTGGPFSGFGKATFRFLRELSANNDKAWFEAHRADYERHYVSPAVAFIEALGPELSRFAKGVRFEPRVNGSLFRIQRDIRFSKDKTPYRDHIDLWFWYGDRKDWSAPGFFLRLEAKKLTLGAGVHRFDAVQVQRFRAAVLGTRRGEALSHLLGDLVDDGPYELGGATRRSIPRGFPGDHPRADLLLHDGMVATLEGRPPREVESGAFVAWCAAHFRRLAPLCEWLLMLKR